MTDWVSVFVNGPVPVKVYAGGPSAWDWEGTLGFGDSASFTPNVPDEPGITVTVAVDSTGVVSLTVDGDPNGQHPFGVFTAKPASSTAWQISDVEATYALGEWDYMGGIGSDVNKENGIDYPLNPPSSGLTWTPNPQSITDDFPLFGAGGQPFV